MKSKGLQTVVCFLSICMRKTHQMTIQNNQILVIDNLEVFIRVNVKVKRLIFHECKFKNIKE